MAAFISNSDFLKFFDSRTVAELVVDSDTPASDLSSNAILTFILERATGDILASAVVGGRYSEAQLNEMAGNNLRFLQGLAADLGMVYLIQRRGGTFEDMPLYDRVMETLKALAKGEKIFPIDEVIEAGHAASPDIPVQSIMANSFIMEQIRYFPTRRWTTRQL